MTDATSRIPKPQGDGGRNRAKAFGASHFCAGEQGERAVAPIFDDDDIIRDYGVDEAASVTCDLAILEGVDEG